MKERDARDVKRSHEKKRWMPRLLLAGVLALGVAGAFAMDAPVREWQVTKGPRPWRDLAEACSRYGDWPPLAAGVVGVGLVGRWRKSRRVVMVCALMLAASLLAGAIVNPLRAATGRARPSKKVEAGWYSVRHEGRWLIGRHAYSSFPSAHTTVAVAFAVPLFLAGWRIGLCGAVVAVLIGWSRIYLGAHHPSDVAVGAILGCACGWVVVRSPAVRRWTWRAASAACGMPRKTAAG